MIISGVGKIVDGQGSLSGFRDLVSRLEASNLKTHHLTSAVLRMGWHGKTVPENCVVSACSPMAAAEIAQDMFTRGEADAVVLNASDHIRSDYTKEERARLMVAFAGGETHLDGYVHVAEHFAKHNDLTIPQFRDIAAALFANYQLTSRRDYPDRPEPDARWFDLINPYFRGVDCANPYVDFDGGLVFLTEEAADACNVAMRDRVKVMGNRMTELGEDTLAWAPEIAKYDHLADVYRLVCEEAAVDFTDLFIQKQALLEVYTCYPVVPMGFLTASGIAANEQEIPELLQSHEVTLTGGLNLGRAAWNNTTLNNIITMVERLTSGDRPKIGGVHGNGSIGYQQGFMILQAG